MDCPSSIAEIIINNTRKPVFWKDGHGRYLGANQAFIDFFGLKGMDQLIGRTSMDVGLFPDPEAYRDSDRRALNGERIFNEIHVCVSRGREMTISVTKSPFRENGRIAGLFGMFEDITDNVMRRKEVERLNAELKLRIADYDILMDSTRVSIVKIRLDDELSVCWQNDAMFRAIGWSREEYRDKCAFKMRRYFRGCEDELAKLEAAISAALGDGAACFELFMKMPTKSGFIWVRGVGTFTDYADGHPTSLFCVYTDVTDVMETQKKLAEAEMLAAENERLQKLIDNVPSGLSLFRGKLGEWGEMSFNRYLADRFGIPQKISGITTMEALLAFIHPEDHERCMEDTRRLFSEGVLEGVYRFISPADGRCIWTIVRSRLTRGTDGVVAVYYSYTNIDDLKRTEADLRESRRIYEEALLTGKLAVWTYDLANRRIILSDNDYTLGQCVKIGISRVLENVPDCLSDLYEGEDLRAMLAMYAKVARGENASCEAWLKQRPGREMRCERVSYAVVKDDQGRPVKAYGMGMNITAEKKVAERYERELEFMRSSNDYNLIAKGRNNLTQNMVEEYTPLGSTFCQHKARQNYDEACAAFVSEACFESDRQMLAAALDRNSLIRSYQQGKMQSSVKFRRKTADGSIIWTSMIMNTYMTPDSGDLKCFTYSYDITENVFNSEIMSLVSETAFDYIGLIYSRTNAFEFLKKSPRVLFPDLRQKIDYDRCCGYVRAHFVNEDEAGQFNDAVSLKNILAGLQAGGRHTSTYRRTEGSRTLCKQMDYVWLDKTAGIILSMRSDVTTAYERDQGQLRAIEAAKLEADKANTAKSSFLASMSHDLRTPLNGVLGFTDVALRENDPAKKQDYLGKIQSSGKLLLDLVNDTLELSRIESGKMTLEPQAVEGREFWESVATSLRPTAELRGVRFTTDPSKYPSKMIWIDRLKVQKVVLNLLSNAIKYTPAGGEVSFRVEELAPPVSRCTHRIIVADNGIGMSPEFLTRLYEPFSQEHRPEAANIVGTGLGLSIVKKDRGSMGGSISVASELNKGTTFTVDLPLPCGEGARAAQKKAAEPQISLAGKNILLCEDNYLNREIAVILLRDQGMEVDCAADGKEGLEKFAASAPHHYDAVLMDLRMPVMDGCESARRIRALSRADAGDTPIIAMTADAFEEDFQRTKEAGMNGHVTKPIDPEKLFNTLRENVKIKR